MSQNPHDKRRKGADPTGRPRRLRPHDPQRPQGLARRLAKSGHGTRSEAERIVRSGRVTVGGEVCTDPSRPVRPDDEVLVDGLPLDEVPHVYLALHKPVRVVTVPGDRGGRRLVADLLPRDVPGLNPAGRLDAATSGLLLVSNDMVWNDGAARGVGLEKEYRIRVSGRVSEIELGVITAGMQLPGLGYLRPELVQLVVQEQKQTTLRLVTMTGKVRQIRRLFGMLRHDVLELSRTRIGPISLADLPVGRWRPLLAAEIAAIRAAGAPDRNGP